MRFDRITLHGSGTVTEATLRPRRTRNGGNAGAFAPRAGRYSGRFANDPKDLPGKYAGDAAEFTQADITDWMFLRNDKIVGGATMRPLLKSMRKADAEALRARLETP